MKFVVQNTQPLPDFVNEIYHQKKYYDWHNIGQDEDMKTEFFILPANDLRNALSESEYKNWCPVGTVEFCVNWYEKVWHKRPEPKNVPEELWPMCRRRFVNMERENADSLSGERIFVKDMKTIKSDWNGFKIKNDTLWYYDCNHYPHFHFQASEVIPEIMSEWRCFICNGELIDIKNYNGDPFVIPQREYIEEAILRYTSAPAAYTLDIACCKDVNGDASAIYDEIVEVHDFFACGLYGFSDKKYPIMLWRWFKEFTKNN